jgi:hypothetical protein
MTGHVDLDRDPVTAAWLRAITGWDTQIAELQAKRARAVDLIKAAMQDATEARIGGRPVATWTWSKPGQRLDRKKLEGDFGKDVIDGYLTDNTPARPFKILENGDG